MFSLIISCVFVQNAVFMLFLGLDNIEVFFKNIKSFVSFSVIIIAFTSFSSLFFWLLNEFLLIPFALAFLQSFALVLIVFGFAFLLKFFDKNFIHFFRTSDYTWFWLVANSAVLGICLLSVQKTQSFLSSLGFSFFSSIGFVVALLLLFTIQKRLENVNIPKALKGAPSLLICTSIISMAFYCFAGIIK